MLIYLFLCKVVNVTSNIRFINSIDCLQQSASTYELIEDDAASIMQRKPKLTLTRPKESEFETVQRVCSVRVKSSAELEEEMIAKIPKFKAHPLNKKNHQWKPHLSAPKTPLLQTSMSARPRRIKSSEELENALKFRARSLNKKIFESKGDMDF
ncbi:hypothetical protein F0562_030194 [Nyssa sinensis]|uniref:TPX2 central domain-containing protein n=1 Tax=Nyssa sinensis TaxID=561372 RepID=A0A5J5B245_9ASTE|nr:hypothetical protein F0562_030194 [Nyssa sinensis]